MEWTGVPMARSIQVDSCIMQLWEAIREHLGRRGYGEDSAKDPFDVQIHLQCTNPGLDDSA
jgi:hypothetical protein